MLQATEKDRYWEPPLWWYTARPFCVTPSIQTYVPAVFHWAPKASPLSTTDTVSHPHANGGNGDGGARGGGEASATRHVDKSKKTEPRMTSSVSQLARCVGGRAVTPSRLSVDAQADGTAPVNGHDRRLPDRPAPMVAADAGNAPPVRAQAN